MGYVSDKLGLKYWLIIICLIFGLHQAVHELNTSCEYHVNSINLDKNINSKDFSEGLARTHLRYVTNLGPRPTGSPANEIHAPKYLLNYFQEMQNLTLQYGGVHSMEFEKHISKQGSFVMNFLHNRQMTSVYRNLKNLLVRLHDTRNSATKHDNSNNNSSDSTRAQAVLVNCHYDSVVGSPGASDDFISCSVMMEIIRLLIVRQSPLQHDVIFLFNGAEENLLQASHAFVEQHAWMKDVKTFVNLEGAGAAGKMLLFQAGPKAPWLVEEFAKSVSRPFASVLGMELFQSGLIPSDTDFRIFRDHGKIPGLDLAFINNGYIYHTHYDEERRIPAACLQLVGNNILSFVETLAQSPYVLQPQSYLDGDVTFFDVLGYFMIYYHSSSAVLLNLSVIGLYLFTLCRDYTKRGSPLLQCLAKATLNHFLGLLFQAAVALGIALVMSTCGYKLSWYARRYNLIGLYVLPMMWAFFTYHSKFSRVLFHWPKASTASATGTAAAGSLVEEAHFYSAQLFLAVSIFICTLLRIYSAYILLIWLLFALLGRLAMHHFASLSPTKDVLFTFWRLVFFSFPILFHTYSMWGCHEVFIPILGRSGPLVNPEYFVVALIWLTTCLLPLNLAGDVYITKNSSLKQMNSLLLHLSLSFIACILFTQIGFPYDNSAIAPRNQRVIVLHSNRFFRNHENIVEQYDSGLWLLPLDANGKVHLQDYLPELRNVEPVVCEERPYCGVPQLYPLLKMFSQSYVIPTQSHSLQPLPVMQVVSKVALASTGMVNVTVIVSGPTHNHFLIMTDEQKHGVRLKAWSLSSESPDSIAMPDTANGEHYFVYNAFGDPVQEPLLIWMLFDVAQGSQRNAAYIQVALSANYLTGYESTAPLQSLLRAMPDWAVVTSWSSTYESWKIPLFTGATYYE